MQPTGQRSQNPLKYGGQRASKLYVRMHGSAISGPLRRISMPDMRGPERQTVSWAAVRLGYKPFRKDSSAALVSVGASCCTQ
jgi:hypothetical protein